MADSPLKILVLFAHPRYESSVVNKELLESIEDLPFVTIHDLYEVYPDFDVDAKAEQKLLLEHDVIVWHHPFHWYSAPPLMKQWIDLVLEFGWAYGPGADKLTGKIFFNALTAGGAYEVYQHEGRNRFTIREFLTPFEQTAVLCHGIYFPPFVVHAANTFTSGTMCHSFGNQYRKVLTQISSGLLDEDEAEKRDYLNIWAYEPEQADGIAERMGMHK